MYLYADALDLRLARGRMLRLPGSTPGYFRVARGVAWLTSRGSKDDRFVACGERVALDALREPLIEAVNDVELELVVEPAPARRGLRALFAEAVSRFAVGRRPWIALTLVTALLLGAVSGAAVIARGGAVATAQRADVPVVRLAPIIVTAERPKHAVAQASHAVVAR